MELVLLTLMYAACHTKPDTKWMCELQAVIQWQHSHHRVCSIFWPVVTNYDKCSPKPNTRDAIPQRSHVRGTIHTFLWLLTTREETRRRRRGWVFKWQLGEYGRGHSEWAALGLAADTLEVPRGKASLNQRDSWVSSPRAKRKCKNTSATFTKFIVCYICKDVLISEVVWLIFSLLLGHYCHRSVGIY